MQFDSPSLSMILKAQSQLYDLHTHLLGMGNPGFWIDTILMDRKIMPTNRDFKDSVYGETLRHKLCPLVWDKEGHTGFVDGIHAANFFSHLVEKNILPGEEDNIQPDGDNNNAQPQERKKFSKIIEDLEQKDISPVLLRLINKKFNGELLHRDLNFGEDFSYDVVLTLSDLAKGLGVKQMDGIEFDLLAVTEKLVGYLSPGKVKFRDWIIFNARKQEFEIVYGIQVEELRELITIDPNKPDEAKKLARAHIINAFSMCDALGSPARLIDLHSFQGSFTPEFYPRRFSLKDSIYSQRLDILTALIVHIIERYQTSLPPVRYCEFSIGVGDLSKQWMFDVLRSVQGNDKMARACSQMHEKNHTYISKNELSSFSQLVLYGHFPHIRIFSNAPKYDDSKNDGSSKPPVTYKLLAGFGRQNVQSPLPTNQNEALRLLYNSPQQAILLMIDEIIKSKDGNTGRQNPQEPFAEHLQQLKVLKENGSHMPAFYDWVVGLDLFGDELGYPYCPFVARPFITYIDDRRKGTDGLRKNDNFGLRIHCGENVIYADDDSPAYRLFIAHMYIAFRCLRFLQRELKKGIRIGHGIAFDRILGTTMKSSRHRKSCVLLAEMREHANYLFKTIAFEVNITSNEYLLGQILRQGDFGRALRLDALFKLNANIILATDDDGIWPLDQCKFSHPGHHSLSAEYCRAITSSMFSLDNEQSEKNAADRLTKILENTPNFCFWDMEGKMPEQSDGDLLPLDDLRNSSIIVHPDIIRFILDKYKTSGKPPHQAFNNYKIFFVNKKIRPNDIAWKNDHGAMRVAFICICANHDVDDEMTKTTIRNDYLMLFKTNSDQDESVQEEFEFIYQHWRKVRLEFIFRNDSSKAIPYVEIMPQDQSQQKYVIYSEPPIDNLRKSLRDNLKKSLEENLHQSLQQSLLEPLQSVFYRVLQDRVQSPLEERMQHFLQNSLKEPLQVSVQKSLQDSLEKPLQDMLQIVIQDEFIRFLKLFRSEKVIIYASVEHMNIETTVTIINDLVEKSDYTNEYQNMFLYIYMNKNKNKYTYDNINNRFKLRVNPRPFKRDCSRQNFLYVLCQHAGAATTALHLISEQLCDKTVHTSVLPSNNGVIERSTTTAPFTATDDRSSIITTSLQSASISSERYDQRKVFRKQHPNGRSRELKRFKRPKYRKSKSSEWQDLDIFDYDG